MTERPKDPAQGPGRTAASTDARTEAEVVADARRVAKSTASAGDKDLRDAETYRALREKEKP